VLRDARIGASTLARAMIRCVQVHKSYPLGDRQVPALRGVDLSIDTPGFFGIMGASGSGKSTLMHLLAALDSPDQGEVWVGGRGLHTLSERELTAFRRRQIGIVFQQFNLIPTLTARENVELPGMLAGDDPAKLRARSGELLEYLGIGARGEHRPDALSGGEQQRVAIARALLYKPPVVLADEPTGNLDSASSLRLWALLKDIAREQAVTIVMVTHEPAAASHCRRVFVLMDGKVTGQIESEGLDAGGVAARYQQLVRPA
jgi:putative ABC transport system ATP-binding protein